MGSPSTQATSRRSAAVAGSPMKSGKYRATKATITSNSSPAPRNQPTERRLRKYSRIMRTPHSTDFRLPAAGRGRGDW